LLRLAFLLELVTLFPNSHEFTGHLSKLLSQVSSLINGVGLVGWGRLVEASLAAGLGGGLLQHFEVIISAVLI
jgi:hypothetical protein